MPQPAYIPLPLTSGFCVSGTRRGENGERSSGEPSKETAALQEIGHVASLCGGAAPCAAVALVTANVLPHLRVLGTEHPNRITAQSETAHEVRFSLEAA